MTYPGSLSPRSIVFFGVIYCGAQLVIESFPYDDFKSTSLALFCFGALAFVDKFDDRLSGEHLAYAGIRHQRRWIASALLCITVFCAAWLSSFAASFVPKATWLAEPGDRFDGPPLLAFEILGSEPLGAIASAAMMAFYVSLILPTPSLHLRSIFTVTGPRFSQRFLALLALVLACTLLLGYPLYARWFHIPLEVTTLFWSVLLAYKLVQSFQDCRRTDRRDDLARRVSTRNEKAGDVV